MLLKSAKIKFQLKDLFWLSIVLTLICYNFIPVSKFKPGCIVRNKTTDKVGVLIRVDNKGSYQRPDDWIVFTDGRYVNANTSPAMQYHVVTTDYWNKNDLINISWIAGE